MMNKTRFLFLLLSCLFLSGLTFAAQIESFDYASDSEAQTDWAVSGNDTGQGGSATVYAEDAIKKEGISSVLFEYNYSGNLYYQMQMTKTLSAPLDLSQAKQFSMWVYGDTASSDALIWYIRFYSGNGYVWRYVDMGGIGDSEWQQKSFDPGDMELDPYEQPLGSYQDNPDISDITKIEIVLQQTSAAESPGTANVYFDDLQYETENDYLGIDVLEDFNYESDTALESVWAVTVPTDPSGFVLDISRATNSAEGAASMQMDFTIMDRWRNLVAIKTFDSPRDMSEVLFLKMWIYGDAGLATENVIMQLALEDTSLNRIMGRIRGGLEVEKWHCYWFDLDIDEDGSAGSTDSVFWQDDHDGGGDFDITQVNKIGLFTQGEDQGQEVNFTCYVDLMEAGYPTTPPPPPVTSVHSPWQLYE